MGTLAVVAYPTLSDDDRQWIEGIRGRYDPRASRIAAHFTLVFPTEVAEAPVVAQVTNAIQSFESIPVVLGRAAAFPYAIGNGYYVSLLTQEGYPELFAVHDTLHNGVLAAGRRRDIPFVPHVTVGGHAQLGECERIARQLNEERRIVRAQIESIDVIDVGESIVRTVVKIPLRDGANRRRTPQCSGPGARGARPPAVDRDC